MRTQVILAVLVFAIYSPVAFAADVWALGGFVGPCSGLQWYADALLFNTGNTPAQVRLLSVSDGPDDVADSRELDLLPGQTAAILQTKSWAPRGDAPLFMWHLDVPDGVIIEGMLSLGTGEGVDCGLVPRPNGLGLYGATRFPHFRALVPANQKQVHLGTTLGQIRARNNVGIFNAGENTTTAHIELLRACDNHVLDQRTVQLAPNSTTQVRVESDSTEECADTAFYWLRNVIVRVDQPSLTWVSTLANDGELRIPVAIH